MANQMIALQARNPQLPDPARATAQYANMMNMASQQRASQLQGDRIRQEMEFAKAKEGREIAMQTANISEKDLDYQLKDIKRLRNIGVAVLESGNEEAYQSWVGMVEKADQQLGATIRQVAPTFNPKIMQSVLMEADKYIDKTIATPTASLELGLDGTPRSVQVGGPAGTASQSPVYDAPETPVATPRATPTAPQAASANPMAPGYKPNTAAAAPGSLSLVINSALETGVMAKADFDKMLSLAAPESRAKIAAWAQQNNIQVTPDVPGVTDNQMRGAPNEMRASPMSYDGQTPQSQFAVYRGEPMQSQTAGLRGAPEMQQTLAQTQPRTITKLQQRNPNVSPTPGVYNVPTQDVAAKARAERETPGEVYAKEKARAKAQREAALEAGPKPLTVPQEAKLRDNITKDYKSARSTIDMMLNPVAGVVAAVNNVRKLSPTQKEAITGYSGYLPTIYAGTKSADTAVKNLKGKVTEMGKSVAALTGAIGQMAVQEWRIVSDMIASLDLEGMGAADLDTQLDIIEAQARRAAAVTRDAYENQYVEEFARYPGRFRLPDASAVAAPAAKRKTPTKGAVDRNNPLLRN
jgi:hypothetical protein